MQFLPFAEFIELNWLEGIDIIMRGEKFKIAPKLFFTPLK